MTGKQKAHLRGLGQNMEPSLHLGKDGVTPTVLAEAEGYFKRAELLKIRCAQGRSERDTQAEAIAAHVGGTCVGTVGCTALIYRTHPDPALRRIRLPEAPARS